MEYLQYDTADHSVSIPEGVLNLIINGIPSIQKGGHYSRYVYNKVLNLIINGIPSIPQQLLSTTVLIK